MYTVKSPKGKVVHCTNFNANNSTACRMDIRHSWEFGVAEAPTCQTCKKIWDEQIPDNPEQELARLAIKYADHDYLTAAETRRLEFLARRIHKPQMTKIEIIIDIDLISRQESVSIEDEVMDMVDCTIQDACWSFGEFKTAVKVTGP